MTIEEAREYSATKIMGWKKRSVEDEHDLCHECDAYYDSSGDYVLCAAFCPDQNRDQLWLVMNNTLIFDTEWIARTVRWINSNHNYPDDPEHQHHYANWALTRDRDINWSELCRWAITLPNVALKAICEAHKEQA